MCDWWLTALPNDLWEVVAFLRPPCIQTVDMVLEAQPGRGYSKRIIRAANVAIQYSVEDVLAADQGTEQATHRKTLPSATASLALAQGPCYPTKLLASVTCGSLSSEREFPVTAPLGFWTPAAAAYFYSHYNLGT